MVIFIILLIVYMVFEFVLFMISFRIKSNRQQDTLKCLRKFIEFNVLQATLSSPIDTVQATVMEKQKIYLRVECLNAKPWAAYLFDMEEVVTIGRQNDNKISIKDTKMSRVHCKIFEYGGCLYLQDLDSSNGTKLISGIFNRRWLEPNKTVYLKDGDIICVGCYKLRINYYYGYQVIG